jgi:prolyl-tRNA editing enzyme YbaK/EbsC (Cys-tRNA(Pro) deacylase)
MVESTSPGQQPFQQPPQCSGHQQGQQLADRHPNVVAVQNCLVAVGSDGQVLLLPEEVRTAPEAAAALGVGVAQIVKSLVFEADGDPILVLASGAHRVDIAKVAVAAGADRVRQAKPEVVREHTGQPIGGVAPVGHPRQLRTFVDQSLEDFDLVWAAGGIPRAVFKTSYVELLKLTCGTTIEVA